MKTCLSKASFHLMLKRREKSMLATILFGGRLSFRYPSFKIGGIIISKKQAKNFLMPSFENKTAIDNRLIQSDVDFTDENGS
jgi:hypothetical protein